MYSVPTVSHNIRITHGITELGVTCLLFQRIFQLRQALSASLPCVFLCVVEWIGAVLHQLDC